MCSCVVCRRHSPSINDTISLCLGFKKLTIRESLDVSVALSRSLNERNIASAHKHGMWNMNQEHNNKINCLRKENRWQPQIVIHVLHKFRSAHFYPISNMLCQREYKQQMLWIIYGFRISNTCTVVWWKNNV